MNRLKIQKNLYLKINNIYWLSYLLFIIIKLRSIEILKGVNEMWYMISDSKEEVVFFSDCTKEQAEALLQKKIESCKRQFNLKKLSSKPDIIVFYGCTRVNVSQKNVFVEVFVRGTKK